MAMSNVDISQISLKLGQVNITSNNSEQSKVVEGKWGLPLTEVYKIALNFYKDKEGKAVQLSYEDKLQLVGFAQQVSHGPLANSSVPPVGALDVVGRDRRLAWQRLGDLSADQARTGFVSLLSRRCPLFEAYIEAHRRDNEEQQRKAQQEAMLELERRKQRETQEKVEREIQARQLQEELARRKVQQALNEQTYEQFRSYAEHQFPGDPERQGNLVKQLQEQHYFQCMQHVQAQSVPSAEASADETPVEENTLDETTTDGITSASMWTRADLQEFKDVVSKGEGDGFLRVGHGERVIVKVPTRHDARRLFWEFATDHYDIGFGVFFEWGTPVSDQVLVHVSGSEDDDDDDEEEFDDSEYFEYDHDLETGPRAPRRSVNSPLVTEIVPVYRRDSHTEVYVGSHIVPGQGSYLLRFDNSYSLWRSKTLYYRVYYTDDA